MPTEYIIGLNCSVIAGGVTLDSTTVTFDLSHELIADAAPIAIDLLTGGTSGATYDMAIEPMAILSGVGAAIYPAVDMAVDLDSMVLSNLQAGVDAYKIVSSQMSAEIDGNALSVDVNATQDKIQVMDSTVEGVLTLDVDGTIDKTISGSATMGESMKVELTHLMRSLLTIPPQGKLCILNSAVAGDGERPLDKGSIYGGLTTILSLEAVGTRLDSYVIEFFVRTSPELPAAIYKNNLKTHGGINIQSITPTLTDEPDSGIFQKLIAQVVILPADTEQFSKTQVVTYEVRMSNSGLGEEYRVAPRPEKDEMGIFTIVI